MATLVLNRLWLNLVATGAAVSGYSAPGRAPSYGMDGTIATYAGGRQRSITREGVHGSYVTTLLLMSRADITTLRGWMGQAVQVRDDRGRVFVGVFRDVPEIERQGIPDKFDVPLSLGLVS